MRLLHQGQVANCRAVSEATPMSHCAVRDSPANESGPFGQRIEHLDHGAVHHPQKSPSINRVVNGSESPHVATREPIRHPLEPPLLTLRADGVDDPAAPWCLAHRPRLG